MALSKADVDPLEGFGLTMTSALTEPAESTTSTLPENERPSVLKTAVVTFSWICVFWLSVSRSKATPAMV
eukprot:13477902-Heterocapsa_arctica.AAC.1